MTEAQARKTGSRQALKSVLIGLATAQLIMTLLGSGEGWTKSFLWFRDFDYWLNVLLGIGAMLLCGYFFGQRAGAEILIRKRNAALTGIICGVATLFASALLGSLSGFFREGLANLGTADNPVIDYLVKPVFWITVFGLLPAMLTGLWFGRSIRKAATLG